MATRPMTAATSYRDAAVLPCPKSVERNLDHGIQWQFGTTRRLHVT